jgi:cytochrome c
LGSSSVIAAPPPIDARQSGLTLYVYEVEPMSRLQPLVDGQTPNVSRNILAIDLNKPEDFGGLKSNFLAEALGYVTVDAEGEYQFQLRSDDGSELLIDGRPVLNHDGLHDAESTREAKVKLPAGEHEIRVRMFQRGVEAVMQLKWMPPGAGEFTFIPADRIFTEANVVHVTSPGKKKLIAPITNTRPGDGEPEKDVHPSFTLSSVVDGDFQPKVGGIDQFPDGRLAVCTWDERGDVFIIDPKTRQAKRFATGLAEPLGLKIVEGEIYVLQKQELTQLIDHDRDGVADEYKCISADWPVTANFHEFAFGLVYKDGWFYFGLAVAINPGGSTTDPQISPDSDTLVGRGQIVRVQRATGKIESYAQGLRTPNGIGLTSAGEIYVTDNQGDWLPSSKLLHIKQGHFYGSNTNPNHAWANKLVSPPIAWLPHGEIGNSPSQPAECVVGPWKGQILHGDVTHGGIKRTFIETIRTQSGEVENGCVFRFSQGFEAGVNRLIATPDGSYYVGEIGGPGNWGQDDKARFGLQKLTFNDIPTFEILAVRAKSNGFELEFTEPLRISDGGEPTHYDVRQWRYTPANTYGGPKVDETTLQVKSATVSQDRRRVFLEIDGRKAGHVVYIRVADGIRNEQNKPLWTTEAWYTLNAVPDGPPSEVGAAATHNALSDAESAAGWTLLFDGQSLKNWRGTEKLEVPDGWKVIEGELRRVDGGGDLVTIEEYDNFELTLDWKISPGGNSGVIWRAGLDELPVWRTGPEMQILDNARHPDGRNPLTSAGSCYALIAPPRDVSLGADRWNTARIVADGPNVTYFLNGEQTAKFDMASPEWKALIEQSKFKDMPNFGKRARGHLVLQDHGDLVAFRNIKIRPLGAAGH